MAQPDPFVGRTLGGRFEVKKKIGQGGMAAVYGAVDTPTGHPVAIKILPREFLSEPEYVQRFLREAQSIKGIRHPNVIRIFGMGKEDGLPFYAMEYLPYPDLEGHLKARRTLPLPEVLELALGMLRGLEVTHAEGLFHRDIKPANVVVAPENRAILVDFGLVKDTNRTQLTATGAVMGTPLYMSPELIQGTLAEAPSDVYQVGLLVFEMISGLRAHAGNTMIEVAHKVISGDFEPIEVLVPDLPKDWIYLVRNMLGNRLEHRYATATQAIEDLLRLQRGEPLSPLLTDEATQELRRPAAVATGAPGEDPPPAFRGLSSSSGPSFSSSFVSRPPPENAPIPRWIIGVFLFASLTLASMLVDLRGDYQPQDVVVQAGLAGFRVSWKTGDPTASVVQVKGGKEADWRPFFPDNEVEGGVRDHTVSVGGFEQGDRLEFRLVGPEGTPSPSREVELLQFRVRELRLEAQEKGLFGKGNGGKRLPRPSLWRGPVRVVLHFKTSIQVETFLLYEAPDGEKEVAVESRGGLEHRVAVESPPETWRNIRLAATTEIGDLVEESLAPVLVARSEELGGIFSEADLEEVCREAPSTKAVKTEDKEAFFLKALAGLPAYSSLEELSLLSPWALTSSEVPWRSRLRTYRVLDQAFRMAWFAHKEGVDYLLAETPKEWGLLSELPESGLSGKVDTIPVPLGSKDSFGAVLGARSHEVSIDVPRVPKEDTQCELELSIAGELDNEMGLEIYLNDQGPICFYGRRSYLESGNHFFHGFPAGMLARGTNRLRVEILNQYKNVSAATIRVKSLALRIPGAS